MDERNFSTKQAKSDNDIIAFYDAYARSWDTRFESTQSTSHFLERRWHSFTAVLRREETGARSAELGVGTGRFIDRAAQIFDQIVAVDGSAAMLAELTRRLQEDGIVNVAPMQANVLSMPAIPSGSVQVVYFFGLLEHIVKIDQFFKEVRRILGDDGIVIGVMPNGESPWYFLRKLVRSTGKHCSTDRYYTARNIRELCGQHGFTCEQISYWGVVPAGIRSNLVYRFLAALEGPLERTPFNRLLGGLTFRLRKNR